MVKNYGMKKKLIKLTQKHGRYLKTHFATARGEAEIALQLIFQYPLGHFLFRGSRTKISVVMDSGRVDGQNKIGPEEFQHHDPIDPPCVPSLLMPVVSPSFHPKIYQAFHHFLKTSRM